MMDMANMLDATTTALPGMRVLQYGDSIPTYRMNAAEEGYHAIFCE